MLTNRTMIACVDVDYRDTHAMAACVLFRDWLDAAPVAEWTHRVEPIAAYEPGQFYRRELPCLLAVLAPRLDEIQTVVVDGYVWLQDQHTPGLGAHLYEALERRIAVVGVAKTCFQSAGVAKAVLRREHSAAVRDCGGPRSAHRVGVRASHARCPPLADSAQARRPVLPKCVSGEKKLKTKRRISFPISVSRDAIAERGNAPDYRERWALPRSATASRLTGMVFRSSASKCPVNPRSRSRVLSLPVGILWRPMLWFRSLWRKDR